MNKEIRLLKLSIVITNYNYEFYIAQAIDSALALRWQNKEVIVVDDGSTDGSRQIIESYGDRITAIFQPNNGQRVATNLSYSKVTGDLVLFLDADDILDPSIAEEAAAVWTDDTSKIQFQMERIAGDGQPTGSRFPIFPSSITPEKIRKWATHLGGYPTPPGSGNLYARWLTDKIFPIDASCGDAPDSILVTSAPFYGDVITISKPLVKYRIHGHNESSLFARPGAFAREVTRAHAKFLYAQNIAAERKTEIPDTVFHKNLHALQHRIPSIKLHPELHPLKGDNIMQILKDLTNATVSFEAMPLKRRLVLFAWGIMVLLSPRFLAEVLIKKRFRS